MISGNYVMAREIAAWKRKVSAAWDNVRVLDVQRAQVDKEAMLVGAKYRFEVTLDLAGLAPEDIGVELVVAKPIVPSQPANVDYSVQLAQTEVEGDKATYALDYVPKRTGIFDVALRIYPKNPHLTHRMDFALVKWA